MQTSNWQTIAGGIGLLLVGAGTVIAGVVASPLDVQTIMTGIGIVSAGLAALGIHLGQRAQAAALTELRDRMVKR